MVRGLSIKRARPFFWEFFSLSLSAAALCSITGPQLLCRLEREAILLATSFAFIVLGHLDTIRETTPR